MIHPAALLAMIFVTAGAFGASGCYQKNTNFDMDARACEGDGKDQCTAAVPLCDEGVCVQCTPDDKSHCMGDTPICGDDRKCQACNSHEQCNASDVCLPSGACANTTDVAYVSMTGNDGACTKEMPCRTLKQALTTGKPTIKIGMGLIKDGSVTLIEGREVTLLADEGAQLDRDGDGAILEIKGKSGSTTRVQIRDLEIRGSSMGNAIDITTGGGTPPTVTLDSVTIHMNQGLGVAINGGGRLNVYRSRIHDNSGGGIQISSQGMPLSFQVIGNFFYNNGTDAGTIGGISVSTPSGSENRLEFNSFHRNKAQDLTGGAIHCIAGAFIARNNILFANTTGSSTLQTSGGCMHAYSIVSPGDVPTGDSNFAADPKFVSLSTVDLRIASDSPAIGKADPNSDLTGEALIDLNGDTRKQPAEIGADELP